MAIGYYQYGWASGQDDDDDDDGDRNGDVDGDTVVPVRVGKSDVTFHGDTDCHVQRTHLKMFLGRIPVMMRRMICFQKLTRPMWARGRPHKTEFRQ